MNIEVDPAAGFCFGVTRVVDKAEEIIREQGQLYCLGEIVHNQKEIERLEKIGLKTITPEEFLTLSNCRVLIRAHGEPPETYEHASKNNIQLIDGTCPIVLRLQSRIKHDYAENHQQGVQFVIFGKKDHAEVRGLAGQTNYQTIIVESEEDLMKIDFDRPVHLYAQTTMNTDSYQRLQETLIRRLTAAGSEQHTLKCNHSICRQVSGRIPVLRKFCARHDVVLFVSYKQSSNGKLLYAQCKAVNEKTYFVTDTADIQTEWLENAGSVGITGATSTPRWLLEEFADKIR
ncbi:MAG: 4-hydroxy-3-methylbut-2-enyl diphosphate reductase [Bacteroidales bacterium]|nr:4-hydroxy-3-methylbut-2-enyl diphosphate reductase [Bacteroidales bacterium]